MSPDIEAEMERSIRAGADARTAIEALLAKGTIASPKQPLRTLEKWSSRGWWDYGVTIDLGWFTDAHPRGSNIGPYGGRTREQS